MKVLHILYQSLPQISGSSIRSRDILFSQKEIGLNIIAVTSPFQNSTSGDKEDHIDGIRYLRTSKTKISSISDKRKSLLKRVSRIFSIFRFSFSLYRIVKVEKPEILHAHAMFFCGLPTILIGKILKIPVVYEFRSLWMFDKENIGNNKKIQKFIELQLFRIEMFVLKRADHVIFINNNLYLSFFEAGFYSTNYSIIKNAVNTTYIDNLKTHTSIEKRKILTFGYIGTLAPYEGLEFLIETFHELYDEGLELYLFIYGDGVSRESILKKISSRNEVSKILYKGAINPQQIGQAFGEIDIIINPRLKTKLTDSVTPLKPLEALAYEKIFVGSDVLGIKEIIDKRGFLFRAGDKEYLKKTIKKVLSLSDDEKSREIKISKNHVEEYYSWKKNALRYEAIYTKLRA